jgi:hypothetical protein
MNGGLRPIEGDPGAPMIESMFDLRSQEWLLTGGGEYQTAAAEVMKADGSDWQRVVILEWPARVNHEHGPDAERTVRLMISPMDALGLAEVLANSALRLLGLDEVDE